MSVEKIQEKIKYIIEKREEKVNKIEWNDLIKIIMKHPFVHFTWGNRLNNHYLKFFEAEISCDKKILKKFRFYRDGVPVRYRNADYEIWNNLNKILDWLLENQDRLICDNKYKKELYRLTKCEKIYNSLSECDEVCEVCGKVLKLGEQCRCDGK